MATAFLLCIYGIRTIFLPFHFLSDSNLFALNSVCLTANVQIVINVDIFVLADIHLHISSLKVPESISQHGQLLKSQRCLVAA